MWLYLLYMFIGVIAAFVSCLVIPDRLGILMRVCFTLLVYVSLSFPTVCILIWFGWIK